MDTPSLSTHSQLLHSPQNNSHLYAVKINEQDLREYFLYHCYLRFFIEAGQDNGKRNICYFLYYYILFYYPSKG